MKRLVLPAFLLVLLDLGLLARPELLAASTDAPAFGLKIETPLIIKMTGHYEKVPDEATYTILPEEKDARPVIHALWETAAKRIEFWLEPGTGLPSVVRYEKRKTGEKVEILYHGAEADFTYAKGDEVRKTHVRADKTFYDSLSIDVLLMGFPFEAPRRIDFAIIDADSKAGDVYSAHVELAGVTKLKVGEKEIECFDILFSLSGLPELFGPKYHFFYEREAPHRYVGYRGPAEEFRGPARAP